ncbi:thioesterase family protein [Pseudorhodoplanes sp.]|uniref:thioesterase family protein n=1 Tax=Pseudorhodoplanes sp. TaxID=1934341 RepID=UPI00391D760E
MKDTLRPGLRHSLTFVITDRQTVPEFYPESPMFRAMPRVFATGYMVGLFEWCCTELLAQHLEPGEGSLGTHVDFSHLAATPPGMTVTVECECTAVDGKTVSFFVRGHDGVDVIGEGRHQRAVVHYDRFNARVAEKALKARAA